jgi:hypothetical protein
MPTSQNPQDLAEWSHMLHMGKSKSVLHELFSQLSLLSDQHLLLLINSPLEALFASLDLE